MADFPSAIASDGSLLIAANNVSSTLNGGVSAIATDMTLASTANFPSKGGVTVESEAILYTSNSTAGSVLSGLTRGADSTTAAIHADGTAVYMNMQARHHNSVKDEIIAIETNIRDRFGLGSSVISVPSAVTIGHNNAAPSAPLHVGSLAGTAHVFNVLSARAFSSGASNVHALAECSTFTGNAATSFAVFSADAKTTGANNHGHIIGFQSAIEHASSGTLDDIYDFGAYADNNGGVITNRYGLYIGNAAGSGTITNQYGIYIESLTKGGTLNYAIYTAGTAPSVFGGPVSKTGQPSFLAYNSVTDADVTGDGTIATVDFDTEVYDLASNFSADTFTAPIAGKYILCANVTIAGTLAGHTEAYIAIVTSNRTYYKSINAIAAKTEYSFSFSVLADMDISDTAIVQVAVSGSTKVVDVLGSGSLYTSFSGSLLN